MLSKLSDLPFDAKVQILVQANAFSAACHLLADPSDYPADDWASVLGKQALGFIGSLTPAQVEEAISQIDHAASTFVKSVEIN
jgi:hypothetical protein